MAYTKIDLADYIESLYQTENFDQAFSIFEAQVIKLGFDAVLYTYIPRILLDSNFSKKPVYKVSQNYSRPYLSHYADARFDQNDPLIKAIKDGTQEPIDWWGRISKTYMDSNKASQEVIATSRDYGIANGITLPTMSENKGISGASFISTEQRHYNKLKTESLDMLKLCTKLFHSMVVSSACHMGEFVKPVIDALSDTERRFICKLAQGKSPSQIAAELGKSEKYLEQVMLKMRRKFSGDEPDDPLTINRNQVLYYAGLINLIDSIER